VKNGVGSTGTHAITEDVRNALAQIAKSTVPHLEHDHAGHDQAAKDDVATEAVTGVVGDQERAAEPTVEAVEILDIPVPVVKTSRSSRRISTQDAEQLLGSVLGALPEPKEPGQGRVRASRRASSAGAVVTPSESTD